MRSISHSSVKNGRLRSSGCRVTVSMRMLMSLLACRISPLSRNRLSRKLSVMTPMSMSLSGSSFRNRAKLQNAMHRVAALQKQLFESPSHGYSFSAVHGEERIEGSLQSESSVRHLSALLLAQPTRGHHTALPLRTQLDRQEIFGLPRSRRSEAAKQFSLNYESLAAALDSCGASCPRAMCWTCSGTRYVAPVRCTNPLRRKAAFSLPI